MHPRQRVAVLKPQISLLNPRNKFAHGLLGAWLFNDDGGLRAIGAGVTENYPEIITDSGPFGYHCYEIEHSRDEMLTCDSPWGQGVTFVTGNYGELKEDWGKHWDGAPAVSTFAIVRRRTTGHQTNILTAGQLGTTTYKLDFSFTQYDELHYKTRAGSESAQGVTSSGDYSHTNWMTCGGTAKPINGGGRAALYADGVQVAYDDGLSHSFDNYDGGYGSWHPHLGGIDYGLVTWADIEIVLCMHWAWELSAEDMLSLHNDPFQAYHRVDPTRYADVVLGEVPVPHYIITLPKKQGQTVVSGDRTLIVEAATAELARDYAEARKVGDTASWADADVTLVEDATDKYVGSTWRIKISGKPVPSPDAVDVSYTAQASDGIDEVGNGLKAALQGPGGNLSTANWAGGVLTVAGAAESLGDRSVTVEITPPGAAAPIPNRTGGPIGTITDEGAVGAALTVEITDAGLPQLKASG